MLEGDPLQYFTEKLIASNASQIIPLVPPQFLTSHAEGVTD